MEYHEKLQMECYDHMVEVFGPDLDEHAEVHLALCAMFKLDFAKQAAQQSVETDLNFTRAT